MNTVVFPLRGSVQHYAWGGYEFLPALLGENNADHQPWAEWWLGAHPKGSAELHREGHWAKLDALIGQAPVSFLGEAVVARFGKELPFLFKVLDVHGMLSIQLHPDREQARAGFAREEAAGIPLFAPQRNYRDANHKPELMVALTDFWLLHGFRSVEAIAATLNEVPAWSALHPTLETGGVAALYRRVMEMPQAEVDEFLRPLYEQLREEALTDKDRPDYWARRAFAEYTRNGHFDRGIFSIYWFHLLHMRRGQGIFQAAGIPHAYLEGVNVELMANSDNVLRGGLTPKHVDVPELLACIRAEPLEPAFVAVTEVSPCCRRYEVPVEDFALYHWVVSEGELPAVQQAEGPTIYCVMEGAVKVETTVYSRGEAFYQLPGTEVRWEKSGPGSLVIFQATVGKA